MLCLILLNYLFLVKNPACNQDGFIHLDVFNEIEKMLLSFFPTFFFNQLFFSL